MKRVLTRSFTFPPDLLVLKHTLIALGVDKSFFDKPDFDTDTLVETHGIEVISIQHWLSLPENEHIIKAVDDHIKQHH